MKPKECPEQCQDVDDCDRFINCDKSCKDPCWKCLFWKNYGGKLLERLNEESKERYSI